jgi:hypothetical protein
MLTISTQTSWQCSGTRTRMIRHCMGGKPYSMCVITFAEDIRGPCGSSHCRFASFLEHADAWLMDLQYCHDLSFTILVGSQLAVASDSTVWVLPLPSMQTYDSYADEVGRSEPKTVNDAPLWQHDPCPDETRLQRRKWKAPWIVQSPRQLASADLTHEFAVWTGVDLHVYTCVATAFSACKSHLLLSPEHTAGLSYRVDGGSGLLVVPKWALTMFDLALGSSGNQGLTRLGLDACPAPRCQALALPPCARDHVKAARSVALDAESGKIAILVGRTRLPSSIVVYGLAMSL